MRISDQLDEWPIGSMAQIKSDDFLMENWDGEAPLMGVLRDILAQEIETIGEQRDKILRYTGRDQSVTTVMKAVEG